MIPEKMSDKEIRLAIAKLCGHTNIKSFVTTNDDGCYTVLASDQTANNWTGYDAGEIPNYPYDLNSMYEAEKLINNNKDAKVYAWNLFHQIVTPTFGKGEIFTMNGWTLTRIARATAKERAIALLKTLNL